ncbi:cyclic nucleotide-binding-like protein [Obelidium mucronatum]|nr:cyclic nucleotide-binding-like protein [Obelidium mucronatum]
MSEDCPPTAPLPLPRLPTPKDIYPDASTANIPFSIPDSHGQGQGLQGQGQDREHASQSPAIQSATTATHANNTGGTENQPLPKVAVHAPSPNQGSDEFHPHIQLLQGFPLFASFPRSILEQISLSAYELKRKEGQVIISKGEEGAEMFFIVDGMVAVVVDGKELSRLSRPVFFGELGVLFKFQRTATIIAKTDTVLAVVTKQKLDEIVEAANPAVQLIMEEFTINKEIWWKQQQYIKSQEKFGAEFVNDIARKDLKSLEVFANAPDSFIDTLAMTLKCLVYKAGEIVIHLNEDSDCMYFVLSGTVEVVGSTGVVHAEITSGSFFGEVGILLNMKRTASIRAKTESRLFKLLKHNLDEVVAEYPSVKNKLKEAADERFYMFQMRQSFAEEGPSAPAPEQFDLEVGQNVLSKLSFFQDVDSSIVTELAMLMKRTTWETGEYIIRCGDDGKIDQFTAPDAYFGEVAIVEQVPRTASVRCINTCSTFELKKEDVKSTMRRHPVLEKRIKDTASNRMQNYLMRNVLA